MSEQTADYKQNKLVTLLLCIFGGNLGLHHFYNKRIGMGILYLFTAGLLCIGSIIDICLIATNKYDYKKDCFQDNTSSESSSTNDYVVVTTYEPSPVPNDILKNMRKTYTLDQAIRSAQIMKESFEIAQKTTNLDTFCLRYDLYQQQARTLLQAEQAGVKNIKKLKTHDACISVLGCNDSIRTLGLQNFLQHEITSAENLKTDQGKLNRYKKVLETLKEHENTFLDLKDYVNECDKIQDTILYLEENINSKGK